MNPRRNQLIGHLAIHHPSPAVQASPVVGEPQEIGAVIGYVLSQWAALERYLDVGFLAIDYSAVIAQPVPTARG